MKTKKRFAVAMLLLIAMVFNECIMCVFAESDYTWDSVPFGGGGYVTGLVFNPAEENLVYARTDIGGAYRWDEENGCWVPLCDMFSMNDSNLYGIDGIAVDPNNANVVYICAGKYRSSQATSYGMHNTKSEYPVCDVLKSTDKGNTWVSTGLEVEFYGNGTYRNFGECIAVDPKNGNNVYVFSRDNELYYSNDAASNWEKLSFPEIPISGDDKGCARIIEIDPNTENNGSCTHIFAGVYGKGVYESTDMGETWISISGTTGPKNPTSMKFSADKLYVTASDGVYVYNNSTWSNISPDQSNRQYNGIDVDSNGVVYAVRTTGDDGRIFKGHIFTTADGGQNWTDLYQYTAKNSTASWWPDRYYFANTSALRINPNDEKEVWISDAYGVWKTDDITSRTQITWTNEVAGMENTVAYNIVSLPEGGPRLIAGIADNSGGIWNDIESYPAYGMNTGDLTDTNEVDFCEGSPNILVRASGNGTEGRYGYSTDYGVTWTEFENFPQDGDGHNLMPGRVAVSAAVNEQTGYPTIFVMPINSGGYYSTDMGSTWNACSGEAENTVKSKFDRAYAFASDRVTADVFYGYTLGNFYVSSDGGANFTKTVANLPSYGSAFVKAAPNMAGTVWVALGTNGIYASSDYGSTFAKLPEVNKATMIAFGKPADGRTNPTAFVVGEVNKRAGIFMSIDMGERWIPIDNGTLIGCDPMCIGADRQEFGTVYLGTNGRGVTYGRYSTSEAAQQAGNFTQDVIYSIIDDEKDSSFTAQVLTNYGSQVTTMVSNMSYSGTKSFKFTDCKSMMRYRAFDAKSIAQDRDAIIDAVEEKTAYLCGWFYFEQGAGNTNNATVRLLSEGATTFDQVKLYPDKWTFISVPLYGLKNGVATNGVIDTNGSGTIYVDDLCVVSTSDGGKPKPTERSYSVKGATFDDGPNRYARTVSVVFDGSDDSKYIGPNGSNVSVDKTFVKPGSYRSLKLAGSGHNLWYLSGAKSILNGGLSGYANNGNLYWTAWMYISNNSGSLAIPGGSKKIGEWFWICKKITDTSATSEWINESGATIYLTDIKLMTFEDKDAEGLQIDKFSLTPSDTVYAGDTVNGVASVYNNTLSNENISLFLAEYLGGMLINCTLQKALVPTFRSANLNQLYDITEGDEVKLFLWNTKTCMPLTDNVPVSVSEQTN